MRDGDGAFGVFAKSEAGDAQGSGFLLNAAGVGQDQCGFAEQAQKIEIADGRNQAQLWMSFDPCVSKTLLRARVNGENYGNLGSDGIYGPKKFGKFFGGIYVRWTVECEHTETLPIGTVLQAKVFTDGRFLSDRKKVAERIDHNVADEIDGLAGAAFFEEMADGVLFGDEEIVGEGIREDAIDFFGHGAIETAQTSFDVGNGNAKLHGGQGNGDGGVDIADHENEIGLVIEKNGLDTLEDFGGLNSMCAGAHFKIDLRRGN